MQPNTVQSIALANAPSLPVPRLVFGFPRTWLPRQLRARLTELLNIAQDACEIGYRDARGHFAALDDSDDGDDYDGPEFVLRLHLAANDQPRRTQDIDLHVIIFNNRFQLQVAGRRFDITFLPSADTVQLAAAARWISSSLTPR